MTAMDDGLRRWTAMDGRRWIDDGDGRRWLSGVSSFSELQIDTGIAGSNLYLGDAWL